MRGPSLDAVEPAVHPNDAGELVYQLGHLHSLVCSLTQLLVHPLAKGDEARRRLGVDDHVAAVVGRVHDAAALSVARRGCSEVHVDRAERRREGRPVRVPERDRLAIDVFDAQRPDVGLERRRRYRIVDVHRADLVLGRPPTYAGIIVIERHLVVRGDHTRVLELLGTDTTATDLETAVWIAHWGSSCASAFRHGTRRRLAGRADSKIRFPFVVAAPFEPSAEG